MAAVPSQFGLIPFKRWCALWSQRRWRFSPLPLSCPYSTTTSSETLHLVPGMNCWKMGLFVMVVWHKSSSQSGDLIRLFLMCQCCRAVTEWTSEKRMSTGLRKESLINYRTKMTREYSRAIRSTQSLCEPFKQPKLEPEDCVDKISKVWVWLA